MYACQNHRTPDRRPMMIRPAVFVTFCVLLSSCAHTVSVEAPELIPVVEQAPLAVTVVYDKSLRNFRCTISKGYIAEEWLIDLGPANVAAFTSAFQAMFADVRVLPEGASAAAADGRYVIRVSLVNYTGCDIAWPIIGSPVAITYSAEVMHGAETVLDVWTASGDSTAEDAAFEVLSKNDGAYLARLTALAVRRAVAEFVWKFEEDERVLAWKTAAVSGAP